MSTTSSVAARSEADRALKNRHRAMWALGNYPAVVEQIIAGLGAARRARSRPRLAGGGRRGAAVP